MYSSMALKIGGPCTFGPPLTESEGVRGTQGHHRIAATAALSLLECWLGDSSGKSNRR